MDIARPDLTYPGVPGLIAVRQKHDELPVARDRGVMLRSLEVRQSRDARAFERIPPEVLGALQLPRRYGRDDQQTRNRRGPPGESGRTSGGRQAIRTRTLTTRRLLLFMLGRLRGIGWSSAAAELKPG